jgi:hypothetical protein
VITHPAILAVLTADGITLLLLALAGWTALRITLHWSPGDADRRQLTLEADAEGTAITGRMALGLAGLSTGLLVVAVTAVLPDLVPGAMCGTGVLQGMGGLGGRAIALRGVGLGLLLMWGVVEGLNRQDPEGPLTRTAARLLLLALPTVALGAIETARAVFALDLHQPVSCCAVVYDQIRSPNAARTTAGLSDRFWVGACLATGAATLAGAAMLTRCRTPARRPAIVTAISAAAFLPAAAVALVRVLSAYHYGVLHHHCPWCLFLPDHRLVGYPLFGALALVAAEGIAAVVAARVGRRVPGLAPAATARLRRAGWRILTGLAVFALLALIPPAVWRIRYGVWMG